MQDTAWPSSKYFHEKVRKCWKKYFRMLRLPLVETVYVHCLSPLPPAVFSLSELSKCLACPPIEQTMRRKMKRSRGGGALPVGPLSSQGKTVAARGNKNHFRWIMLARNAPTVSLMGYDAIPSDGISEKKGAHFMANCTLQRHKSIGKKDLHRKW